MKKVFVMGNPHSIYTLKQLVWEHMEYRPSLSLLIPLSNVRSQCSHSCGWQLVLYGLQPADGRVV